MTLHEADTILFSALSEVGFHPDEATSISDLNTELIYEATVLCLKAITPQKLSANISTKLSNSLMTRFAHCSELAAMCKELGLKGDIDYHTFLYGSVKEVRAVLSFLVEKLPKKSTPKTMTRRDRFLCEFGSMLKQQLSAQSSSDHHQEHVPFMTEPISLNKDRHPSIQLSSLATRAPSIQLSSPATRAPSILNSVAVSQQSDASQQNQYQQLEPSSTGVLRVSATDLARSLKLSRPERSVKSVSAPAQPISASDDTGVSLKTSDLSPITTKPDDPSSSGEADQLQAMLDEARDRLARSRRRFQRGQDRLQQLRISTEKIALESSHLTNQLDEQRIELQHLTAAHQLLHHPEQAEQLLARAKQRQSRHRQQWEERRKQLVQQLSQMKPTLEQLRSERGQLQQRMGDKQIQIDQLKPTAQQLSRTFYLRRIAEVSVTSRQQRATLLASVDQLHVLRQQINADSERLERAFTAAEQLIFKDAVESTWSAAVYRSLASLHDTSVQLVETAERTGTVSRHVQRLQNQIDLEKASGIEESFARLSRDLQAIVDQNSELQRQLNVV